MLYMLQPSQRGILALPTSGTYSSAGEMLLDANGTEATNGRVRGHMLIGLQEIFPVKLDRMWDSGRILDPACQITSVS